MDRQARLRAEINRDARITSAGLAHELVRTAVSALERAVLSDEIPDVDRFLEQVDHLTQRFRKHHRDLSDARVARRAERPAAKVDPAVPAAARPFAYVGRYFGAYGDWGTFARDALAGLHGPYIDMVAVGFHLHLLGKYWTVETGGVLFAFSLDKEPAPTERVPTWVRRRLRKLSRSDEAVDRLVRRFAGRFTSAAEFVRWFLWSMRYPAWLLVHVDHEQMAYEWSIRGDIVGVPDDAGGVYFFFRRDPTLGLP